MTQIIQASCCNPNVLNSYKIITNNCWGEVSGGSLFHSDRSNFVCSHRRERQGGGAQVGWGEGGWYRSLGIDYTEQWRADREQPWPDGGDITLKLGVRDLRQTQSLSTKSHLHYVRGRGGVFGIWACACVCMCVRVCVRVCWGRGGWGLKWERKGDSDRLKKKWRKGGGDWPGAVSPKTIHLKPHRSTFIDLLFYNKYSK